MVKNLAAEVFRLIMSIKISLSISPQRNYYEIDLILWQFKKKKERCTCYITWNLFQWEVWAWYIKNKSNHAAVFLNGSV